MIRSRRPDSIGHESSAERASRGARPFHVMTKPIGPLCNLDCAYCYYLEKSELYPRGERFRMSDEVLDAYVRQMIGAQPGPAVVFNWQGGEPTLMGIDFYRRVVELQHRYCPPEKRVLNALQTNATLIDAEWAEFLCEAGFLVGVSIDGPSDVHDAYRVDKRGRPTSEAVLRGLELLLAAGVEVNVLCVVNRRNASRAVETYEFLVGLGVRHLQFIPLVEALPGARPTHAEAAVGIGVSDRSVLPDQFGAFLVRIFERWIRRDVGRVFVQTFEENLVAAVGGQPSLCIFREECGQGLAVEHNGDVFSCDHFVDPAHRLGNLTATPLVELAMAPQQDAFGRAKRDSLPEYCRSCDVRRYCHGECPKNRFTVSPDGEPGLNYLCSGYRSYFRNVTPWLEWIGRRLAQGLGPTDIMSEMARLDSALFGARGRNEPCPCGSGAKFKRCCGPDWEAGLPPRLPSVAVLEAAAVGSA